MQRQYEHGAAKPQRLGPRRRIGQCLERRQTARRAYHLLLHPRALEQAKFLDTRQMRSERAGVEPALARVLRDRDRKSHGRYS